MKTINMIVLSIALTFCFATKGLASESAHQTWNTLTEQEKNDLRREYKEWVQLPSSRKDQLKKAYEQYLKLSPKEKEQVEENYKKFQALPSRTQEFIKKNFARFALLSPEEKQRRIELLVQMRQNAESFHDKAEERARRSKPR